jgi:hypothetical protein
MLSINVVLSVTLDYDEDAVREYQDYDEDAIPESYLRAALPSFVENEINNSYDFPAYAFVETV